jgi:hypothetical protein
MFEMMGAIMAHSVARSDINTEVVVVQCLWVEKLLKIMIQMVMLEKVWCKF